MLTFTNFIPATFPNSEPARDDPGPAAIIRTPASCDSMRERRAADGLGKDDRKMLNIMTSHLDHQSPCLWGHVLQMPEEDRGGITIVDGTNNILEDFIP